MQLRTNRSKLQSDFLSLKDKTKRLATINPYQLIYKIIYYINLVEDSIIDNIIVQNQRNVSHFKS